MTCSVLNKAKAHTLPSHMTVPLHTIGQGFCGTVWASEKSPAFKREDGGVHRSLKNDFQMHQRVINGLQKALSFRIPVQIHVPHCYAFIRAEDQWWTTNSQIFPSQFQTPCNMIQAQRIPPFQTSIRERLIEKYCPPNLKNEILSSEPNKDCLIRPYLGRRRVSKVRASRFTAFSLRNFPLHLDQLESLMTTADIKQYARTMAETLAVMHWTGEVDGNDIEFVLAPPDTASGYGLRNKSDSPGDIHSDFLGNHSMWVLDFDLCRGMRMDESCVEQVATAFWRNDPYYPKPVKDSEGDFDIWASFKEGYLRMSQACINLVCAENACGELLEREVERRKGLAGQIIDRIERGNSRIY